MTPMKLKISRQDVERYSKGSLSASMKRRKSSDDESSDLTTPPSSSDKEAMPPKAKDTKARDVQVMNKRPAKKRRVVSDDDYEQDKDLSPLLEDTNTAIKLKRDIKGKVKASTSASTSAVSRFVKNDKQQIPKVDETNAGTIMPSQEEPERGDKIVSGVLTGFVDLPQKKKLPTIKKKTKPPGTIPSAAASTTPSANPSPPVKISTVPLSGSGKDSIPITTLNPSGSGDFDLRDSNTWQSLLGKKTTNSGPRVGIEKRVSTQERRNQLDKMREEARALRNEQLKNTFDLQAQSRKILQFEKSLAQHEIQIQGPHILGAAFKDRPLVS